MPAVDQLPEVTQRVNITLAVLVAVASLSAWQVLQLQLLSGELLTQKSTCLKPGLSGLNAQVEDNARALEQLEAAVQDLSLEISRLSARVGIAQSGANQRDAHLSGAASMSPAPADTPGTPGTRTMNFMYGLWDDKPMPPEFVSNLAAWRRLNPAWTVKMWSKAEIRDFWRKEFPEYRKLWRLARPIQRADLARYMIIYKYGGLYADLDCSPTKSLDDVFHVAGLRYTVHNTLLCVEDIKTEEEMARSAQWVIRGGVPEYKTRIANYVFWAKAGSPTLKRAIDIAAERLERVPKEMYHPSSQHTHLQNPYAIIYTTGPDVLTEAAFHVGKDATTRGTDPGVLVLPPDKCHMNNLATGTWIGDGNAATALD